MTTYGTFLNHRSGASRQPYQRPTIAKPPQHSWHVAAYHWHILQMARAAYKLSRTTKEATMPSSRL